MEWISVKDRLPDYNQKVIVFKTYHNTTEFTTRLSTDESGENWDTDYKHYITHWMPEPPNPLTD